MKHLFSLEELKNVLDTRAYTIYSLYYINVFNIAAEDGTVTLTITEGYENLDWVASQTLDEFITAEGSEIKGTMENVEIALNNFYYDLVANYVRNCLSVSFIEDYTSLDLYRKCEIYEIEELDSVLYNYFDNCYDIAQNVDFSDFDDTDEYFTYDNYECESFGNDEKFEKFKEYIDENMYTIMNALSDSNRLESISEEDVKTYLEDSQVSTYIITLLLEIM